MAAEADSHYWLYSILLIDDTPIADAGDDDDDKKEGGGGQTPYFCSYLLAPPPTMVLDTSEYNILRNPKSNKFHEMMQNRVPSQFGRDRVLSLKDSFDPEFNMDFLFQIEKLATGQFFLVGKEKFELKVEILHETEVFSKLNRSEVGRATKQECFPVLCDDVNEQSRLLIEARDEIRQHQVHVRAIFESEQPSPHDLKRQCHLRASLGDVADDEVVDHAALMAKFQGSMFS
ncbi:uncharacterized protein LOC110856800 [Folsomia candida]|uniref:Uncharacterized protein n=1 Tax=Folsomia candida TaxID=158441 RepID=A0A226DJ63_FOLCA|nr:uncharacterized protein LOC110856800 [Folsomia candida]XP_035713343.1 uncharacterized protein LOC110856800 [Folsomia candida]XP_035713344.1 uncharacterized protein LOC110856800 [Folsomia candida]OXA45562.1 hypothetical protein Fcan01_19549 [Folsomia candida]